jgi:hypothetical protein
MQQLTEIALEKAGSGVFTRPEVAFWVGGSLDRQFSMLKRALAAGEVVRLHRGLYCLAAKYLRDKVDPLILAQRIYGPSYISMETALSYHGWIPEAVYAVTSVSMERSREFDTPLGHFSFTRIPQKTLYAEVLRVVKDGSGGGCGGGGFHESGSFMLASPLKALADYVYVHKCDWTSARPVVKSLRVDESSLAGIDAATFDRLIANYSSRRMRRFLEGLGKGLK